ncbi:MAG: DNA recombination protein RmuC [Parvularculaceae bacterium]|nr:DNA recombination protein RmuC [Parvularculaceae bacterium]
MVLEELSRAGLGPDGPAFWLLIAVVLFAALTLLYAFREARRGAHLRADLEKTRITLAAAETRASEVAGVRDALKTALEEKSRLEADIAASQARLAERERALGELKTRMDADFRSAASQMLDEAHKAFLVRASESFEKHRVAADVEANEKQKAINEIIRPMAETLTRYEEGLKELRAEQQKARGELVGRIGDLAKSANDVRMEAQKLSTALRAGSKVRGRWGEEQLRNVVETAGMAAYVDFVEQASHHDGERRLQPDMVVNLPGGRKIAIDSKVSINAYLDAVEATDDDARARHLSRHSDDIWSHVKTLSARDYAASLRDSLDVVVMFIPGENYFAAACEMRPQLLQDAFERRVLIATPTTLVAMLKSASFNWRQEKALENANAVAKMAKDLHDSLRVMAGHLADLGKSLTRSVDKFNDAVGGFERRVLPRARRFAEYELPGVDAAIDELKLIETAPASLKDDAAPPEAAE